MRNQGQRRARALRRASCVVEVPRRLRTCLEVLAAIVEARSGPAPRDEDELMAVLPAYFLRDEHAVKRVGVLASKLIGAK